MVATTVWVLVAVAVALLVLLGRFVLRRLRRFAQVRAVVQADVTRRVAQLRELTDRRRGGRS